MMEDREKLHKGPIAWMAGHSVAANLILLICIFGGLISLFSIKQEVFPDVSLDTVSVTVPYPGASPEEVENGILLSIEESVRGLEGVYEVISVAREGMGMVTVEALAGFDLQRLAQEIKSEVDRILTFPEEAEEPRVRIDQFRRGVLTVVLYGDAPATTLHQLGERLRDFLLQSPDITQVDLEGVPPLEISIEVPQEELRRFGFTLGDIAARLQSLALDIPGGGLKTESGELLVRLRERREYGKQFAGLPVLVTKDGSEILLRDIAHIDDSFAETDRYSKYNGQNAILLEVYRIGDETPIRVANAVRKQLQDFAPYLPPGIETDIYNDRSDTYKQRVTLLLKNGVLGLCLVLLFLGLFLEARLAFWVMLAIPISFMGSFLFLPAADITINMMSLFAFIIALGMVVDSAIVVGENAYHYHQEGMPFHEAAIKGAREVALPVVFSIITNIIAFIPIYIIPGTIGKTFKMIPVVVCIVFIISLVECLFVLPAQLAGQRDRRKKGLSRWLHERQQGFSRAFTRWVREGYGPFLLFSMRHRVLTVAAALGMLTLMMSYATSGRMGFQLFPMVESDYSDGTLVLPYGAPVERTEEIVAWFEQCARQVAEESGHPELITAIITDIGPNGSHTGRVRVQMPPPEIRNKIFGTEEFTRRWRAAVGEVPGVDFMRFASDTGGPGGRGRPIAIELSHRDMDVLERTSTEIAEAIATYPGIEDIDDGFQEGKQQIDFRILPEGKSLGLSARDVARQVRNAFYGAEVLRQQRGRNELKIMVRLPKEDRKTEQTIHDLLIRTPAGAYVPFREIASLERGRAYTTINRRNGRRVVQVSSEITPRSRAGEVLADLPASVLGPMTSRYPGLSYSYEGQQADIRESMASLKTTFILALLAIYAMLAIPFRSYTQPFVVMLSIPFGIVGAFLGHLIMGYDLCIPSMFGIVALAGVVVNNSLVMIDNANNRIREDGLSEHDAIHAAAVQRFRPIILTTMTTFGGLAPMIFETSRQARFLVPMALSLGYGVIFATLITLLIVPSMFLLVSDIREFILNRFRTTST